MMFTLSDDGVVSSVNEENLIYIDKNELEEFIDSYRKLEEENEQLKQQCKDFMEMLDDMCIAYLVNDGLEEILND